jgi:hypothetical protein
VKGRWNDNRHILVTELAESGVAMLALLHVRMDASRRTLDEIAARQRAADEKRQHELERQQQAPVVSPSAVVQ